MEKIKIYIDTMFLNFPKTKELEKAKIELYEMMEDKYTELSKEGKTENEILGIIIGEFGNVDEIAEEFGIEVKTEKNKVKEKKELRFYNICIEDAKGYINCSKWSALRKALALALIVLSGVAIYIGESFNKISGVRESENYICLIVQVIMILLGIGILIWDMIKMNKWENIQDGICRLNEGVYLWATTQKDNIKFFRNIGIVVSLVLCCAGVIVGILGEMLLSLVFAAVGVFLLMFYFLLNISYKNLMVWENVCEEEGQYKVHYESKILECAMSVYWETAIALYLSISFVTYCWYLTWLIIPAAFVINVLVDRFFGKE